MGTITSMINAAVCIVLSGSAAVLVGGLGFMVVTASCLPLVIRVPFCILFSVAAVGIICWGVSGAISCFRKGSP